MVNVLTFAYRIDATDSHLARWLLLVRTPVHMAAIRMPCCIASACFIKCKLLFG